MGSEVGLSRAQARQGESLRYSRRSRYIFPPYDAAGRQSGVRRCILTTQQIISNPPALAGREERPTNTWGASQPLAPPEDLCGPPHLMMFAQKLRPASRTERVLGENRAGAIHTDPLVRSPSRGQGSKVFLRKGRIQAHEQPAPTLPAHFPASHTSPQRIENPRSKKDAPHFHPGGVIHCPIARGQGSEGTNDAVELERQPLAEISPGRKGVWQPQQKIDDSRNQKQEPQCDFHPVAARAVILRLPHGGTFKTQFDFLWRWRGKGSVGWQSEFLDRRSRHIVFLYEDTDFTSETDCFPD